jgi:hypothetical protein
MRLTAAHRGEQKWAATIPFLILGEIEEDSGEGHGTEEAEDGEGVAGV